MKRVVACVVLAVAVAGCGSSEPGWQDEFQDSSRQIINDPEFLPVANLLQVCAGLEMEEFGREAYELELLASFSDDLDGDVLDLGEDGPRTLPEILDDYGVEPTAAVLDEAVQIFLDETERACP